MNVPIDYIEFRTTNIEAVKTFYTNVFAWKFKDYGPSYTAFSSSGVEGGFELTSGPILNGVLVVLNSDHLEELMTTILENKGIITQEIFHFPGGRRFQFKDPVGNELAVWQPLEE